MSEVLTQIAMRPVDTLPYDASAETPGLRDQFLSSRVGRAMVAGMAAFGLASAADMAVTDMAWGQANYPPPAASPNTPPPVMNPGMLPPSVTATFPTETATAHVAVSDIATDKVTILENVSAKGIPAKLHRKLERQGDCRTFDGHKVIIYTQGHDVNNMSQYGRDLRTSRFCMINGVWVRVKCKNHSFINELPPKPPIPGRVLFVNNFFRTHVKVHADATASASCEKGGASATGFAHGEASATTELRKLIKTSHKQNAGLSSIAIKIYAQASGKATAKAEATAQCSDTATPPPSNNNQNRPPTVEIINKPQHDLDTDQIQICAISNDPDGDQLQETWTAQHGNVSAPFHPDPSQPKESCVRYTPNDVPPGGSVQENVTVTESDGRADPVSDTASFPVVDDNTRPFRSVTEFNNV